MSESVVATSHWIELEDRYSANNYHPLDVVLCRGEGIWVYDDQGNRYLDCLAAYSAVNQGHNHPRIVKALVDQASRLALTSRAFRSDQFGPFCEKLSKLTKFPRVLLMNTGAEAVETAIKAARRYGHMKKGLPEEEGRIIVFSRNFHGRTTTIISFSSDAGSKKGFGPFTPGFTLVPYGDLEATQKAFGDDVSAVLVEPIQGEAGVIVPPDGFLPGLRKLCDDHGSLLICDEVQSGLGRAGAIFAHRDMGVEADGVTIGKALSGGLYPVSAFLATEELMGVFTPGSHGSTYGGNPLACAVGSAALDVLVEERLPERSRELGTWFIQELRKIESPHIREIRGRGLWVGLELKGEAGGARPFCEALRKEGMLCKETQTHTIRIAPPLVIEKSDLEWALGKLKKVLT